MTTMFSRDENNRFFAVTFLLASLLVSYSSTRDLRAQQQQSPAPPLQRIRRVKGEQPKPPSIQPPQSQSPTGDEDVVRVDTDLASILLTAVDKDKRFITTLRKEDVRVLEDNAPQDVATFERETDLPLTLAILIDTSRSEERPLPDEKIAARTFIDSVIRPDKDKAAIISFTGEAVLQQTLTSDLGKLRAASERVTVELPKGDPTCEQNFSVEQDPRCWTGIWDAVWVTVNEVLSQTPEHTRRAIILLTDGDDTSSTTKKQEAIDFAVRNNVVIYAIGIGDPSEYKIDGKALRNISEKTGGHAFFPADKPELDAAFAQIQQELRSQYLLTYQPANRKRDGSYRQVKIEIVNTELRKQKLRLLYRQGYYARKG
jgi:Ca-activated chloride channel family protein